MNKLLAVLVAIAFSTFTISAQEPLANYIDRTIAQIAELNRSSVDAGYEKQSFKMRRTSLGATHSTLK